MITTKTGEEIEIMKKGGEILSKVIKITLDNAKVGKRLRELDRIAGEEIKKRGATPSFKKVKGYKWNICSCINEAVVHGIPDERVIVANDILGIDCGVYYQGFHTDAAWSIRVKDDKVNSPDITNKMDKFLAVGKKALFAAIKKVKIDNYIYDISAAIQNTIESAGYSVVRSLVGHGIGRQLHEPPEVPCFVDNSRRKTVKIVEGMVLAIEVIYNMGSSRVMFKDDDKWTIVTKDGKIAGLFEATVAATHHGCLVLTPLDDLSKNYGASRYH